MLISKHSILSLPSNPSAPFNTVGADPHSCEQSVFQHNCSQQYSSLRAAAHSAELFLPSGPSQLSGLFPSLRWRCFSSPRAALQFWMLLPVGLQRVLMAQRPWMQCAPCAQQCHRSCTAGTSPQELLTCISCCLLLARWRLQPWDERSHPPFCSSTAAPQNGPRLLFSLHLSLLRSFSASLHFLFSFFFSLFLIFLPVIFSSSPAAAITSISLEVTEKAITPVPKYPLSVSLIHFFVKVP